MRLNPKLPPGRASRKALLYGPEVRRLRAEGYTLKSIREALLDAGVRVSISTVWREATHTPSPWELDRIQEATVAQPEPPAPVDRRTDVTPHQASNGHDTLGLLSKVFEALRQVRRGGRLP